MLMKTMRICCATLGALAWVCSPQASAQPHLGLLNYWPMDNHLNDLAGSIAGNSSTVADQGHFDGDNGRGGISFGPGKFGAAIEMNGASNQRKTMATSASRAASIPYVTPRI